MKRNFQNFIIRIILKFTLLTFNVNTYNTNEINYNINYLSLSSNNYVQSYGNIFNRWPNIFNRNTRSLNAFESQALTFNNFSAQFSDENSILNSNFTNNKADLENSYNLKIKLFTKIILCEFLFLCFFSYENLVFSILLFKKRYNLFDHSFYLFSRQHFSGNIRVYV